MTPAGLPHSDTPGSQLGCQLPRAYRRLQRPSSALDAKASTMCPSQLVSQTLNKNHKKTQTPPTPHHPPYQTGEQHRTSRALQKDQTTTHTHPHTRGPAHRSLSDARVHYPHVKHPTHQPPPAHTQQTTRDQRHRKNKPPHHQQPTTQLATRQGSRA
jgi:hypothetical protein